MSSRNATIFALFWLYCLISISLPVQSGTSVLPRAHPAKLRGECILSAANREYVSTMLSEESAIGRRRALVVGNAAYNVKMRSLLSPGNDAAAMTNQLQAIGFDVFTTVDASHEQIKSCFNAFLAESGNLSVGVIFYSGHGVQEGDENLLLGINSTPELLNGVSAQELIESVSARAKVTLAFLDACRTNFGSRGTQGLAEMQGQSEVPRTETNNGGKGTYVDGSRVLRAREVVIAYATSPGRIANDGASDLSPFTKALAAAIAEPGWPIERVLAKVSELTGAETGWTQMPWSSISVSSPVFLNGTADLAAAVQLSNLKAQEALEKLRTGKKQDAMRIVLGAFTPNVDLDNLAYFGEANNAFEVILNSKSTQISLDLTEEHRHASGTISPNGKSIVIGFNKLGPADILVWNAESDRLITVLKDREGYWRSQFDFAQNDSHFAASTRDGVIEIYQQYTGKLEFELRYFLDSLLRHINSNGGKMENYWGRGTSQLKMSPDGTRVAFIPSTGSGMPNLPTSACAYIWNLKDGDTAKTVCDPSSPLGSQMRVQFYPNKSWILMGTVKDGDGKLAIYDLDSNKIIAQQNFPSGQIYSLSDWDMVISPSGGKILINSQGVTSIFSDNLTPLERVPIPPGFYTAGFTQTGNVYFSDAIRAISALRSPSGDLPKLAVVPSGVYNFKGEPVFIPEGRSVIEYTWPKALSNHAATIKKFRRMLGSETTALPIWGR